MLPICSPPAGTPDQRYASIVEALGDLPGVTPPWDEPGSEARFGAGALKVNNKIFAMLVRGRFVVKLPRQRVEGLVASGAGEPFDAGRGRPMKEWVALRPASGCDRLHLAREALGFVGGSGADGLNQ